MSSFIEGIVNLLSLLLGWLIAMWITQTKGYQQFMSKFSSQKNK